ncbi:MAG: DUF59 domain-containing protein [Chloroflexi bacterium]|nr:DUF59 domain-containing protein [Chloroflexota bacterium]
MPYVTQEQVFQALRRCYDPEIPLNIMDLGLVYEVKVEGDQVNITMTLTAPGCPLHATIARNVQREVEKVAGVKQAQVEIVWQPPWTPERMSAEAKKKLGLLK